MKNLVKKLFALLLCTVFCCSLMPVYARSAGPGRSDGSVLTVSGSGISDSGYVVNGQDSNGLRLYYPGSNGVKGDYCLYVVPWPDPMTLKVKASGGAGSYKYQWYTTTDDDYRWNGSEGDWVFSDKTAISGATKSSYKIESFPDNQYYYYVCIVTDADGQSASVLFETEAYYELAYDYFYAVQGGYVYFQVSNQGSGVMLENMICRSILPGGYYLYAEDYVSGPYIEIEEYAYNYGEKYTISRKEAGGKWKALKTFAGTPDEEKFYSYTDKTAEMGKTYAYRYRGYINGVWTPYSGSRTITFNPFVDVSLDEERAQYIAWAYNNSVVKGDGAGHFNPDDPCTRMNFVMILWKMHGKPTVKGSNPFSDVSGTTSVNAVKWAVKKKLVTGTSATTFSPDDNLSRINIIMILYKLAGSPKASDSSPYVDIEGAKTSKAVNWAVDKGIISPADSTHFNPTGNCSRALLVEILYKYNKLYKIL